MRARGQGTTSGPARLVTRQLQNTETDMANQKSDQGGSGGSSKGKKGAANAYAEAL